MAPRAGQPSPKPYNPPPFGKGAHFLMETATPETPALANLIDREQTLKDLSASLVTIEAAEAAKREEWMSLKARAEMACDLRDEARDLLNAIHGQAHGLRELIKYHSAPAETAP